jgi:hypothetical protein
LRRFAQAPLRVVAAYSVNSANLLFQRGVYSLLVHRWTVFDDEFSRRSSMAFPTHVNDQITDSVTQANTKVLGDAPAIAMGNLYQATAQALANAAHNATNAQQQSFVTSQASTTMGVATLYAIDTASTGIATEDILKQPSGSTVSRTQGTVNKTQPLI